MRVIAEGRHPRPGPTDAGRAWLGGRMSDDRLKSLRHAGGRSLIPNAKTWTQMRGSARSGQQENEAGRIVRAALRGRRSRWYADYSSMPSRCRIAFH